MICPSDAESCLRKVSLSDLRRHQMVSIGQSERAKHSHADSPVCSQVNFLPELVVAFSDAGGGLCHLFTRSQLTGEPGAVLPVQVSPALTCSFTSLMLCLLRSSAQHEAVLLRTGQSQAAVWSQQVT